MERHPDWLDGLNDEDRAFIKRFVLASGSLKAVAQHYGISYPTVRLRLDRLIQKIEILDDPRQEGPFEQCLRLLYAEGRIEMPALSRLRHAHAEEQQTGNGGRS